MAEILLVDDERHICEMIAHALSPHGHNIDTANGGLAAIREINTKRYDVVITDVMMADADGFAVLDSSRKTAEPPEVIIITGFGSIGAAVDAMKRGAAEYFTKPLDIKRLVDTVAGLAQRRKGVTEQNAGDFYGLVGRSQTMQQLYKLIEHVGPTLSTILISGPSGSGKELVARAIHANSPRGSGAFVPVDCGTLTETLLESELFGHVRGAFTGAVTDKIGLFEAADGGTIFLDEVAELPPQVQQKLLRCIQEKAVRPVGSSRVHRVDVRIIAATNRFLEEMVTAGKFRQDLFYRLNVVPVPVPPLAERREDIELLARHFTAKFAKRLRRATPRISEAVLGMLMSAEWPGNVRQLENVIECAVTFAESDIIAPEHLSRDFISSFAGAKTALQSEAVGPSEVTPLGAAIKYLECQMLSKALTASKGNKEQAANMLGIDRATLYRKLKAHGLTE